MQVNITLLGEELVLLKRERDVLTKAVALLAAIGRHVQPAEMAVAMANAGVSIAAFLDVNGDTE